MSAEPRAALVTGAGRGIGRAIALRLAADGFAVAVNYHSNQAAAQDTLAAIQAQGGTAVLAQADISKAEDRVHLLESVRAAYGRLDLLVNNAGVAPRVRADLLEMTAESYQEVLDTNLHGPFFLTQAAARWMIEQVQAGLSPRPLIVNIGSISAYTVSLNRAEYCIAKAGMGMMTALFAARLAEFGIGVFEVRPGVISTDMTAAALDKYTRLIGEGLLPIARLGKPEDVAQAVAALAQGNFPYSTGDIINVDGGFHLKRL